MTPFAVTTTIHLFYCLKETYNLLVSLTAIFCMPSKNGCEGDYLQTNNFLQLLEDCNITFIYKFFNN